MKMSSAVRVALLALTALAGTMLSSVSHAESGTVALTIYKAGWIIGGSGGGGTLNFRGRSYALSTGGLDYGLVFGGSKTVLRGTVSNINRPSDVAGVYGAAGAGLAVGSGAACDRADQPEGRGAGTGRPADRADGERRFERAGDHVEVAMTALRSSRCLSSRRGERRTSATGVGLTKSASPVIGRTRAQRGMGPGSRPGCDGGEFPIRSS